MGQPETSPLLEAEFEILRAAGGAMGITALNKALFYFDLLTLLETGKMATNAKYVAFKRGPVVDGYKQQLVEAFEKAGLGKQFDETGFEKPIVLAEDAQLALMTLTTADVDRIARVHRLLAGRLSSAAAVSDYAHRNPGWQLAFAAGRNDPYPSEPINMRIAMQQLVEEDPWMRPGLHDIEVNRVIDEAIAGPTVSWD